MAAPERNHPHVELLDCRESSAFFFSFFFFVLCSVRLHARRAKRDELSELSREREPATKFALVTNCARLRRPGERSIIRTNRDNLTMDKCIAGCVAAHPVRRIEERRYRADNARAFLRGWRGEARNFLRLPRVSSVPFASTRLLRFSLSNCR